MTFSWPTNEYQTPITDELLSQYPDEVVEQLYDCLQNIELINWLVSPNRPKAKDCPHDEKGRVIVDLAHPHIIEDMDYFRQPALHFMKHNCYTMLKEDRAPQSAYMKFWREEKRRCLEGYVRESDGEWVTGFCYWFMNYNPMMVNKIVGKRKALRVESFPDFWEGIYLRFHYLYQARDNGKHAIELARRGAHPYFQKVFTPQGWKTWGDITIGSELYGTEGNIVKVIDIPYDKTAPYYKITLRDKREVYASDDHLWVVKVHNRKNVETLTTKELLKIYRTNRKKSYRLPSGIEYCAQIPKNLGVEMPFKQTKVDPYTFGLLLGDGCFRHSACYFTQPSEDMENMIKYIPYPVKKWSEKYSYGISINNWKSILKTYGLDNVKSEGKFIPDEYKYNSKDVRLAILNGLMDTDGCAQKKRAPFFNTSSKRLANDVIEIARSLGYNSSYIIKKSAYKNKEGVTIPCLPSYHVTIYAGKEIFRLPRKKDNVIYNCSRMNGTFITDIEYIGNTKCKCVTVDANDRCYLIGDFITTHNCAKSYSLSSIMTHNLELGEDIDATKRIVTVLTAYEKEYLSDSKEGTLSKFKPSINFIWSNTPFPRLTLKNSPNDMTWQMGYKDEMNIERGSLNQVLAVSAKDNPDKLRGKRGWVLFEEMGSFKGLLALYDTTRKGVEDGNYAFATMYLVGTSAEKESDFTSAKTLLYGPDAYNILSIPNVYDKKGQGRSHFGYFFPSYMNRLGCYNKDGVSDVVKALLEVLLARYKAKYSADPKSVLRVIAEDPITPAEAIIKVKSSYFPVVQLNERIQQLDTNPASYDDVYVGNLLLNKDGEVVFKPSNDTPIRQWGEKVEGQGAIEIFEMPEKDRNGNVYGSRYIIGHDPVDNDQSSSDSLSSTIVFDLFTDKIVAEFTGRKDFANDNFEIVRLLCIFYNAKCLFESNKKGLFAYFSTMKCTHYLAETPEYLREKQLVKYASYGSNKYGVNATAPINDYANSLIRDWLLKPTPIVVNGDNGEELETTVPTLMTIRNRALLDELVNFNPVVNVDRIRALGMVMLLREEKIILYQGDMSRTKQEEDKDYLGNDPFFNVNIYINDSSNQNT